MDENTPNQKPYSPDLRAAYEKAMKELTLDEVKKYEIEEEGFPLEDIIEEMEVIQRQYDEKQGAQ